VKLRLLLVTFVTLAVCPAAEAYTFKGKPWPGGTIRYYNAATDQAWAVSRAFYVWNHSGARIQFVPSSRETAQLVIDHFSPDRCLSHANATVGFVSRATIHLPRVDERSTVCNSYIAVQALAHELGHVLGLGHEDRGCALMNSSGTWQGPARCRKLQPWTWNCSLLHEDDIRGAVALYGGQVAATNDPACSAYTPIGAPPRMVAAYRPEQLAVGLRFVRPALPRLPLFIAARIASQGGYAFASARNSCPSDIARARRYGWSVRAGEEMRVADRPQAAGRYCFAVWALDGLGRPSDRPAVAWADVPAPVRL
jgi:hypothetical protein